MDYDSSTKFISSLAKFLQSLCNGYVEFDSGVQVIGHLYLSVDTGKTIDYILNEKVCKTDENSVTFISNSFHAQPAEKPKPPGKKTPKEADKVESKLEDSDSYNGAPTELSSTNVGTVPSRNISSPHAVKRPLSPSLKQSKVKSGRSSPKHKKSRNEQADHNAPSQHSNQANENSVSSVPSPSDSIPLHSEPVAGVDNESYPHGFFNPDEEHSLVSDSDERDIKPNIDTDVTFIKEEFAANSGSSQSHDRSHDDPSGYSYQSNPVFPGGYLGASGFGTSPRSNYAASSSSQMYSSNSGPHSKEEGPGDSSEVWPNGGGSSKDSFQDSSAVGSRRKTTSTCRFCQRIFTSAFEYRIHKLTCRETGSISCPECGTLFRRKDNLRVHMRNQHSIGDPTVCQGCGMCFRSYLRLNEHMSSCGALLGLPIAGVKGSQLMEK